MKGRVWISLFYPITRAGNHNYLTFTDIGLYLKLY